MKDIRSTSLKRSNQTSIETNCPSKLRITIQATTMLRGTGRRTTVGLGLSWAVKQGPVSKKDSFRQMKLKMQCPEWWSMILTLCRWSRRTNRMNVKSWPHDTFEASLGETLSQRDQKNKSLSSREKVVQHEI